MYALVDCNNFYVSCERVFQPHLNHQPIVVLSNNDGCIISRSYEAKALGIPMGAPEFKYRELLKQHKVHVFSSNYALYGDLSRRVMTILEAFTPTIEVYSIDEAFLNFDGMTIPEYHEYGIQMKQRIQKWLSIPICVGFAETKALSKVANKIAKKYQERTKGVYVIDNDEKRIKALKWTKIEDVWGIGRQLTKKMKAKNIHTAYDFTMVYNEAYIKNEMGVVGMRLIYELQGKSVLEMEEPATKKNIAITRSFDGTITSFDELKERVSTFASVCAEKLRKQNSCCYTITLFISKDKYKMEGQQRYAVYHSTTLPFASNSGLTLSNEAVKMLKVIFEEGAMYKKAGVLVSQLIPQNKKQFDLFVEENPKHQKLMEAIDIYHKKSGTTAIRLGNQDLQKTWKMRQNHLSNKYTSDIHQILEILCH